MISLNQKSYIFNSLTITIFLLVAFSGCTYVDATYKKITSSKSLKDEVYPSPYQGKIFSPKTWPSSFEANKSFNQDLQFAIQQFNLNNFSISEFYLKKTLVKEPDNPIAIKLLPWTYFYQKRYNKALKAFDRTKAHYKKKPELFIGKGWCYFAL